MSCTSPGVACPIQEGVESALQTFVNGVSSSLSASLIPVALSAITIYVILTGWAVARGDVQNTLSALLWKFFRITLICAVALGGGTYQSVVVQFLSGIEGVFTNAISGTPTVGALIDANMGAMDQLTNKLFIDANAPVTFPDMTLLFMAVLCSIGQVIITLAVLVPLVVAKVAVGLLLGVGPVFILCALFQPTQRFTEAWLSATLGASFTTVVVSMVVGFLPIFINSFAMDVMNNIGTVNLLKSSIGLFIVICCLAWLGWKSSEFGASLVGGSALGNPAAGIAQSVMNRIAFRAIGRPATPATSNSVANASGTGGSAPLAHQNVITNINRSR